MSKGTKYTTKYFYDSMPKWKRIKDPILTRIFYRPVSFWCASICANCGIGANAVSYVSAIVALIGCILFLPRSYECNIAGGILCNVWIIMDCIDGNLARGVKKQAFGVFADAMSSYLLVGFMVTAMGFCVYNNGGVLIDAGNVWIILVGAVASTCDTMMRLIYQKYKSTERELQDKGILEVEKDVRLDESQTNNWRVRLESDWGIGGILPLFILLGAIFGFLDIVVLYCFIYYAGAFLVTTLNLVRKAIKAQKKYEL